ncbi:MAG: alpha/beta hydrolase [Rhodoferax sp.]|nr:alpha/beta hydrolase [Rhodoferax sp.]
MTDIAIQARQILLLPGWQDSGPGHWQSRWQERFGCQRVQQHDWLRPLRGDWIVRLEDVVLSLEVPVVLVAHSLGCQLVAAWAAISNNTDRIHGALLVAPGDVERDELRALLASWSPPLLQRLPFKSMLVASSDDPYCSPERAAQFASAWGADLISIGAAGHINADSGLADWPAGQALLQTLISQ